MKVERVAVDLIDVGKRLRPVNEVAVAALAESMQRLGQLQPISVYNPDGGTLLLVAGLHRLEAGKRLGWEEIDAVFTNGNEIDRQLQEIAENLHRAELTVLERSEQITRWVELTAAKARQGDEPLPGGKQPTEKGQAKAARELGISEPDARRAVKVASISPKAKQAARDAGLDDNRTALLAVAKEVTAEAQVAKVGAISSTKTAAKAKAKDQVAATNVVEAAHLIDAVDRFADFCRTNSPASVTAGILQGEVAEVRVSIVVIREWLGQLAAGLGRVEATDIAPKAAEHALSADIVPPAKHEPVAAASDRWRDLGIPTFLRREQARSNATNPGNEVPAL
jgi:ParB-like chromosome segregation protein Spo0J